MDYDSTRDVRENTDEFNIYDDVITYDSGVTNAEDDMYLKAVSSSGMSPKSGGEMYNHMFKEENETPVNFHPETQETFERPDPKHSPNEEASYSDEEPKGFIKHDYKEGDKVALYLGNLSWWTTDQLIEDLLTPYGKIEKIRFVEDKTNGKSKGQCFASFEQPENALKALQKLKDVQVDGKLVTINLTSIDSFESLNTHNRGRKERREYFSQKPEFPPFRGAFSLARRGARGGFRGRARGAFRGIPDVSRSPPDFDGFMPHNRAPRFSHPPFPPFLPPAHIPGLAPHINPAFFHNFGHGNEPAHRDREHHREHERERERDRGGRERREGDRGERVHRDRGERDRDRTPADEHHRRERHSEHERSSRESSGASSSKRKRGGEEDVKVKKERHRSSHSHQE